MRRTGNDADALAGDAIALPRGTTKRAGKPR
jgi:hypothetical protein